MKYILYYFVAISVLFSSCSKKIDQEIEVYYNDFESNDLTGITLGSLEDYNNTMVLGRYNAGGFDLQLNNLPEHKLIEVTFDLYIHDNWNGMGIENVNGPDIWKMIVDDNLYINTTFSNDLCDPYNFCPPQSYPLNYPNSSQNPKTASAIQNLPGGCTTEGASGTTTLYKITKRIEHNKATLLLQCRDQLIQNDTIDNKCDESWSVDNIRIKVIDL